MVSELRLSPRRSNGTMCVYTTYCQAITLPLTSGVYPMSVYTESGDIGYPHEESPGGAHV